MEVCRLLTVSLQTQQYVSVRATAVLKLYGFEAIDDARVIEQVEPRLGL